MNTKLYVGNLPFSTTEEDLKDLFAAYGDVAEVFIPTDRESGRPRGFAFVTMASPDSIAQAVEDLHGTELEGRALVVNEAKPLENRGGDRCGFRRNDRGGDRGGFRRDDRNGRSGNGRGRRY